MERVESETFGLGCPDFADVFVGRQPLEGLEPFGEIVGCDEVAEMGLELIMAFVVIPFDGGVLDGSVHPLDLTVGPRMVGLGQPVVDAMAPAGPVEGMAAQHCRGAFTVFRQVSELDAVVGQDCVDVVRHRFDQGIKESRGDFGVGPFRKLDEGELGRPVDRHE